MIPARDSEFTATQQLWGELGRTSVPFCPPNQMYCVTIPPLLGEGVYTSSNTHTHNRKTRRGVWNTATNWLRSFKKDEHSSFSLSSLQTAWYQESRISLVTCSSRSLLQGWAHNQSSMSLLLKWLTSEPVDWLGLGWLEEVQAKHWACTLQLHSLLHLEITVPS